MWYWRAVVRAMLGIPMSQMLRSWGLGSLQAASELFYFQWCLPVPILCQRLEGGLWELWPSGWKRERAKDQGPRAKGWQRFWQFQKVPFARGVPEPSELNLLHPHKGFHPPAVHHSWMKHLAALSALFLVGPIISFHMIFGSEYKEARADGCHQAASSLGVRLSPQCHAVSLYNSLNGEVISAYWRRGNQI